MARYKRMGRDELGASVRAAARAIVAADGLPALNARALAQAAGCSVGMLYAAHASLDELVRALNGETLDELHAALAAAGPGGEGAEARFLALVDAYVGFAELHTHRWQAVFAHRPADGAATAPWYADRIERIASVGADALLPLCGGDPGRARRAATLAWAGVHGVCDLALSGKLGGVTGEDPRRLARDLARGFLAGLIAGEKI